MRWMLIALVLLGLLVAALGVFERAVQLNKWSSLIASAQDAGVLQNEAFSRRLQTLPPSPFTTIITLIGAVMTILAVSCLSIHGRSRK